MKNRDRANLESGAGWREILEYIPQQIIEIDLTGRVLYMNRTFTDRTVDEIVDTNIFDYIPEKDRAHMRQVYQEVARTGKAKHIEHTMVLPDWSQKWFACYIIPIEHDGKVTYFIAINQDITEQKTAEKALRESEHKFRVLAEQSPNVIFINQKGRVVFANRVCEQLLGYTQEELCAPGFEFLSLIAPESVPLIQRDLARHMHEEEVPPREYSFVTKAGERLEGLVSTRLFSFENEMAILGIVTDITQRKKAEESLKKAHDELELRVQERTVELTLANQRKQLEIDERIRTESALKTSEEMLRSILDSSPDSITVIDRSGNFVECNQAALRQFRFRSKQEMLQRNSFDLVSEKDQARAMRNIEEVIRKGTMRNIEYEVLRRDGSVFDAETSAGVIKGSKGEFSGFVVVTKDISERKASEQALLLSQAELRDQKKALEQKNIALGEIIAQVEVEKQKMNENITLNVRRVLFPILDKLDQASDPKPLLDVFRHHLDGLTSTYGSRITEKTAHLTPREVEICNMIKGGLPSKDIAELLKISRATVERHRKNIRGKLKLTNQDVNLAVFLRSLQ